MNRRKPIVPVENDSEYLTVHRFKIMECLKNFERDSNRNPIIGCTERGGESRGSRESGEREIEKKINFVVLLQRAELFSNFIAF